MEQSHQVSLWLNTLLRHRDNSHHPVANDHSRSPALCSVLHGVLHDGRFLKPRVGGWRQAGQIERCEGALKNLWCLLIHIR